MMDGNFLGLLTISLMLGWAILFIVFQFDILEPVILVTGTMTFSVFLAWLNVERWDLYLGFAGYAAILSAMAAFAAGSLWSARFGMNEVSRPGSLPEYKTNDGVWLLVMLVMIGMAYFSVKEMSQLAASLGNQEGLSGMIRTVRPAIEHHQAELSRWMNYRQVIAQSIAYVYFFAFARDAVYQPFRLRNIKYLLPVILYMPFVILTTGRMALICLIIYMAVTMTVLYQRKHGYSAAGKKRACLALFVAGLFFLMMFFLLGIFTGKVIGGDRTPFVILSHYAGLSIPALDTALQQVPVENIYLGSTTLNGIYRILSRLGLDLPEVQLFLPFVQFNDIDTNVYTAEFRYIKDYGYVGMWLVMWLLGAGYTWFYRCVSRDKGRMFGLIFYGSICYPLFLSSIDERFFLDLVGTPVIYLAAALYVSYKIILQKGSLDIKKNENHE